MNTTKGAIHRPEPRIPRPDVAPDQGKIEDLYAVLRDIKVDVNDIKRELSAKRKDHLTVEEVADEVGRSPYTIRRWITEGRIDATRIQGTGPKGRLLIPRDQLENLILAGLGANITAAAVDCVAQSSR